MSTVCERVLAAVRDGADTHHAVAASLDMEPSVVSAHLSYLVRTDRIEVAGERRYGRVKPCRVFRVKGGAV